MKTPELKRTIFQTPIINFLLGNIFYVMMRGFGWSIAGEKPGYEKYLLLAAPHTSNWDFILIVIVAFKLRMNVHWMGKKSLFSFPFKTIMLWLGGIPIDRSKTNDVVKQVADQFSLLEDLVVLIPPEGTRSKVTQWKSGFYHIAEKAGVPLVLGFIDMKTKTVGFGPSFHLTGNIDSDITDIKEFYNGKEGIVASNQ